MVLNWRHDGNKSTVQKRQQELAQSTTYPLPLLTQVAITSTNPDMDALFQQGQIVHL